MGFFAYDTQNKETLFYEEYSGSINDVSQLEFMIGKAAGYGYKKIGFILDRGYFSRGNINCMDNYGYHFVIMVKGMNKLVNSLILQMKGSFENKWAQHIDDYDVYGTTIKRELYETDTKERYFHLFHSSAKEGEERTLLSKKLRKMKYDSEIADRVNHTFHSFRRTGLSYKEAIIATMRELNQALEKFKIERSEEALWGTVMEFQGYRFRTYSGLPFSYQLKKGRSGVYTKELFIDRPKALGDIRGVTYIYALFYRFGLIDVPEEVKDNMESVKKKVGK